jgi:replicative DNA helicase
MDFADQVNRVIFEHMKMLTAADAAIDITTVVTSLKNATGQGIRDYDLVGGAAYLATLPRTVGHWRKDVKPATKINWRHTRRNLLEFFGPDKPIREITAGALAISSGI